MSGTIVVGVDGSECANEAITKAMWLAKGFGGARLVLVYGHSIGTGAVWRSEPDVEELEKEKRRVEREAAGFLKEAVDRVRQAGLDASYSVLWESPADALLAAAAEEAADLIVVGTHGAGSRMSSLFGHVPHKLLHHAAVPLVVVPCGRTG